MVGEYNAVSPLGSTVQGDEISIPSQAQGDILYYNGTAWVRLAAGTSGQFFKTLGAAANPAWASLDAAFSDTIPSGLLLLSDDWSDNKLSSRTATFTGQDYVSDTSDNHSVTVYASTGDTTIAMPEWTNEAGTPDAAAGNLDLGSTEKISQDTVIVSQGDWRATYQWQSNPTGGSSYFMLMYQDSTHWVGVNIAHDGVVKLRKNNAGSTDLITGSATDDALPHDIRVTRNGDGDYELFVDDSSQGTTTDTYTPTLNTTRFTDEGSTVGIFWDDFSIRTI